MMRCGWKRFGLAAALLTAAQAMPVMAVEPLSIVGSSTVFPFVSAAVEAFRTRAGDNNVAVEVESTGTGGGMRFFCAGAGAGFPDITNASRPMTPTEKRVCAKNGVKSIVPLQLGFDGITLVAPREIDIVGLRSVDLYRAIAAQLPTETGFVVNTTQYWDEINPALPHAPILILGPPQTSGTRDFIETNFMTPNCRKLIRAYRTPSAGEDAGRLCTAIRTDSGYMDAGEDDAFLIEKVIQSKGIIGLVGFGHAQAHADRVRFLPVDDHYPSPLTIRRKLYPLARPLFVYFKGEHMRRNPALKKFAAFIASETVMQPGGLLSKIGLVVPSDAVRDENRRGIENMSELECGSPDCVALH